MTTITPQEIARERAEVMLAYANGAKVEGIGRKGIWYPEDYPNWDWANRNYRIAKPKPKKVKLLAWLSNIGELRWFYEDAETPTVLAKNWKRVPSEDKEIEVSDE